MPSHFYNYPKVVPVVPGPSPHRKDDEPSPPPAAAREDQAPQGPDRS